MNSRFLTRPGEQARQTAAGFAQANKFGMTRIGGLAAVGLSAETSGKGKFTVKDRTL